MPDRMSPLGLPLDMRGAVDLSRGHYAGTDDLTKTMDVHDSEVNEIHKVLEILRQRATSTHNYDAFQREIIDRFARIGFVVDVRWYETDQPGVLIPEINISARTEADFVFDRDKQTSEVTSDLLGLGEGGVLKVDKDMMKALEDGTYKGQSGHQH
jgi:hypothetical protein